MIFVSHRRRRRFARRLGLFFDPIPITVARVDSPSRADALALREPTPRARPPSRARDVARRFRAVDGRRVGNASATNHSISHTSCRGHFIDRTNGTTTVRTLVFW